VPIIKTLRAGRDIATIDSPGTVRVKTVTGQRATLAIEADEAIAAGSVDTVRDLLELLAFRELLDINYLQNRGTPLSASEQELARHCEGRMRYLHYLLEKTTNKTLAVVPA